MEFSRRINGVSVSEEELRELSVTNDTLENLFYSAVNRAERGDKQRNRGEAPPNS